MNKQQKQQVDSCLDTLAIHSMFRTIQGEGPYSGRSAIFVRFAGCNLQCPGCDTEYTRDTTYHTTTGVAIMVMALKKSHDIVVITGGEPFRQPRALAKLCQELSTRMIQRNDSFCDIQIESNGTLPCFGFDSLSDATVSIVVSPKTPIVNPTLTPWIIGYKYVLSHDDVSEDGLPGRVLGSEHKNVVFRPSDLADPSVNIYVQPMDTGIPETNAKNLQAAIKSCLDNGFTLGLQVHKIIGLE